MGCGCSSPIKYCSNITYSIGVDAFKQYLNESRKEGIHKQYILANLEQMEYSSKIVDAVLMIDVLEHLPKSEGLKLLQKAEKWARKKVILNTPNGFIPQSEIDKNIFQLHLSGWKLGELEKLGYECHGLAGLKCLRKERKTDTPDSDLTSSIRFQPRSVWFILASLSQIYTYYLPRFAFEIFCVKRFSKHETL